MGMHIVDGTLVVFGCVFIVIWAMIIGELLRNRKG